jgi:hypothetical protein
VLERLWNQASKVQPFTEDASEHQAFVELLVAALFADHRVTQGELDAIETFDETHTDWDAGGFTIGQYFGAAAAKVRRSREDGLVSMLVMDISARLRTLRVRDEAIAACADMLAQDGMTDEEREFLAIVDAALR